MDERLHLVVEVDSALCHGALIDQADDEARAAELEVAGWQVERFTDSEVWFRPQETVDRLRSIRKRLSVRSGT